jgi:hypothetical protein
MSFSSQWLALREPADHAARNLGILSDVAAYFHGYQSMNITDIGCGTGSNLRGCYHKLSPIQHWLLVDYDDALLKVAFETLLTWADEVQSRTPLIIKKGDKTLHIAFKSLDLNKNLAELLDIHCDLLTSAAFFDLCSKAWIDGFVQQLTKRKIAFYTVLTYDGHEQWSPSHINDAEALKAFHAHQATDKGFGLSAGHLANECLVAAFQQSGYSVKSAKSPWVLTDKALINALLDGSAKAVAETGQLNTQQLHAWQEAHKSAEKLTIGHDDLFCALYLHLT